MEINYVGNHCACANDRPRSLLPTTLALLLIKMYNLGVPLRSGAFLEP